MPTLDDAASIALAFEGATEGESRGNRSWSVAGKAFAWERPFSKADVRRFGTEVPSSGPILAVRVADLELKDAILQTARPGHFTIPHFDGYPAILLQLDVVRLEDLEEVLEDAWDACLRR